MITRSLELAILLTEENRFYSYSELSAYFELSERSVRYEIEHLQEWLKKRSLNPIELSRSKGVRLTLTKAEVQTLNQTIYDEQDFNLLKSEERMLKIFLLVIQQETPLYVKNLQDILIISKSTLDNDLKKLRTFLKKHNVVLISKPKMGLEIVGSEMAIRIVLSTLIHRCCNIDTCMKRYRRNGLFSYLEQDVFRYFDFDIIHHVYTILFRTKSHNVLVNENYYIHLALDFAITLKRIREGHIISEFDDTYRHYVKSHIYDVIEMLSPVIEDIPISEMCFLCFIIDSYNIHKSTQLKEDWMQIQLLTVQIIMNMEKIMEIEYASDAQLFERLFYHIEALVKRTKQGMSLFNPMTGLIKEQYAYTFFAVKQSLKELEVYCNVKFDDAEIAYMTVHFCASGEKIEKERFMQYRVVILCGHGVATGELLAQKLSKITYLDVIGVINSKDINILKRLDAHLVIKTIDMEIPHLPSIKINPLFGDIDLELLKKELKASVPRPKIATHVDFKEMYNAILNLIQMEDETVFKKLKPQIEALFLQKKLIEKEGVQPMLEEVLELHHILLQKEVENWEEAIRLVASPLIEDHHIEKTYVDAMIANVHKFGPYIVIAKGFALAHARPEDGVNKLGVSILTLAEPVAFHSAHNDPVQMVVCLAAVNNNSHLKIMAAIATLLGDEQKMQQLYQLKDAKQFKEFICSE